MERGHRDWRCNRCSAPNQCGLPEQRSLPDEISAEIRRKKKELVWTIVQLVFALALAAAIGALLLSGTSSTRDERADGIEDSTGLRRED